MIWRAFIYDEDVDPDRAKRAYIEFTKLDGQFRPNVLVQVKNGAIDFMPREPFHPLFGAMKQTPVMAEIQATQEYLGQAKHLVYLGTMWKEFLDADTYAKGKGSTVGKVIEGAVIPQRVTGMVSVAQSGLDRTGAATTSRSRTGTRPAGSRGILSSRPSRSPTSGRA